MCKLFTRIWALSAREDRPRLYVTRPDRRGDHAGAGGTVAGSARGATDAHRRAGPTPVGRPPEVRPRQRLPGAGRTGGADPARPARPLGRRTRAVSTRGDGATRTLPGGCPGATPPAPLTAGNQRSGPRYPRPRRRHRGRPAGDRQPDRPRQPVGLVHGTVVRGTSRSGHTGGDSRMGALRQTGGPSRERPA